MKIVLAGPSGAGKTTIISGFIEFNTCFDYIKSYTTRSPRNENDDEYVFIDRESFENKIAINGFFEYEYIFNNYYGLSNEIYEKEHVILNMDVKGAQKVKNQFSDAIIIMILPPSYDELYNRLVKRGCKDIEVRLNRMAEELTYIKEFNYIIVNDDINHSIQILNNIFRVVNYQKKCQQTIKELYVKEC